MAIYSPNMEAPGILKAAADHMADRAKSYDSPQGERSMKKTIDAFNALTGRDLKVSEGWLLMSILKAARSQQGAFKEDNHEDMAAYVALYGEELWRESRVKGHSGPELYYAQMEKNK